MPHKKILHFITDLDVGGTELMLTRLLPHLKQSFDTRVICAMKRGPIGALLESKGIPVTYLNLKHRFDFGIIIRFFWVVKKFKPDILVTHLIHPDIFGRLLGRLFGIPIIICSQQGSLLQWEFLRRFDRLTASLVDRYIVQTDVAKQELVSTLRLPPDRFVVIPNSVLFHNAAANRDQFCQRLGILPTSLLIVCVSRLRQRKGHEYLLSAFEQLYQLGKNISLLLVGDGERKAALMQQVSGYQSLGSIFFMGNRSDVPEILSVSDIFVLPTLAEGMSNAILEAMAAGLPCVVSDIPVNHAVIQHDVTGRLFETAKTADLINQLRAVIGDPLLRARLGHAAQRYVRTQFDPIHVGNRWVETLNSIHENARS